MNTSIWGNFQICISLPLTLYQIILKDFKFFEYFKSKLAASGVLFAQETLLTKEIEQTWKDELNEQIIFSHGKFSPCGVFIAVSQ